METDNNIPITYNENHYTIMANDIVHGKQDMSLQEAKLLRLIITQIVKEDMDFKTYTCKIIDLANFLDISKNNLYRDIQGICSNLMQRVVCIRKTPNNPKSDWKIINWLSLAEYESSSGIITLKISEQMAPYLLGLNEYFSQYKLSNILNMHSFYAIRLYELLKTDEFKGEQYLEYSIQFLRQFFDCEKKHLRISDFKKYVLETAYLEINKKTDIKILKIEYTKKGRVINKARFYLAFPDYYKSRRYGILKNK